MNIEQGKKALAAIGYNTTGNSWEAVLESLHTVAQTQVVGSSVFTLGDAQHLYVRSGNAAFMVDNVDDLWRACKKIKAEQDGKQGKGNIVMVNPERSVYIRDIARALDYEITNSGLRDLGVVTTKYSSKHDPETLTQTSVGDQVLEDLLSDSQERNDLAASAFKSILLL